MQVPRGATVAQLEAAMLAGCTVVPRVTLLNASGNEVGGGAITRRVLVDSGQVSWLSDAEVTRTLTLDLNDPTHALNLDSDSPEDGAIYADRMIRVTQVFSSPLLPNGSCSVDVFTGPLVKFSRKGTQVALEAHGKEYRARTDVPDLTIRKGRNIADAIETIMRERCGETRFAFPKGLRRELQAPVHVGRADKKDPWTVCQRLAASIDHQLFYNGSGVLVLRREPTQPVHTFTLDASQPVEVDHDWSEVYNRVVVAWSRKRRTKDREKRDAKMTTALTLDDILPNHPFGPRKMAANGVRWTRTLKVDASKIHNPRDARNLAERKLRAASMQTLDVKLAAIPAWHLDPRDPVATPDGLRFPLREAQAPLAGGPMTLGTVENVRRPRR